MEYLLVGIGGVFGSVSRYLIGKKIAEGTKGVFPLGTFLINISGALLLGIVSTISNDRNMYLLLGDGFLGAFTTFSTFMYEEFSLIKDNEIANAVLYIVASIIIGVLSFAVGTKIGTAFKG